MMMMMLMVMMMMVPGDDDDDDDGDNNDDNEEEDDGDDNDDDDNDDDDPFTFPCFLLSTAINGYQRQSTALRGGFVKSEKGNSSSSKSSSNIGYNSGIWS